MTYSSVTGISCIRPRAPATETASPMKADSVWMRPSTIIGS